MAEHRSIKQGADLGTVRTGGPGDGNRGGEKGRPWATVSAGRGFLSIFSSAAVSASSFSLSRLLTCRADWKYSTLVTVDALEIRAPADGRVDRISCEIGVGRKFLCRVGASLLPRRPCLLLSLLVVEGACFANRRALVGSLRFLISSSC